MEVFITFELSFLVQIIFNAHNDPLKEVLNLFLIYGTSLAGCW